MTRSILAVIFVCLSVGILTGTGCKQTGVGDPCTPEQEFNPQFNGFDPKEVNVESKSFQCQTRLCLVNHFQGRVSCPYGQQSDGTATQGAKVGCAVPGGDVNNANDKITGNPAIPAKGLTCETGNPTGACVPPQCTDRTASNTVYCSCRCANIDNRTDDGANYCTCPDGFACTQLVTSIGQGDTGLTGAYCVKNNTQFKPGISCSETCDATQHDCADGNANGAYPQL